MGRRSVTRARVVLWVTWGRRRAVVSTAASTRKLAFMHVFPCVGVRVCVWGGSAEGLHACVRIFPAHVCTHAFSLDRSIHASRALCHLIIITSLGSSSASSSTQHSTPPQESREPPARPCALVVKFKFQPTTTGGWHIHGHREITRATQ